MEVPRLNLTTAEVRETASAAKNHLLGIVPGEDKNIVSELELLGSVGCHPASIIDAELDEEVLKKLGELSRGEYYNFYVMLVVSCIVVSLYQTRRRREGEEVAENAASFMKIHNWLRNLKEDYNSPGINMTVTLGALAENKVDIKYKPKGLGDITHEVFVGIAGTNRLRLSIPNFVFVYGGFSCSGPLVYQDEVYGFCDELHPGNPLNYAVTEDLSPSYRLDEVVGRVPPDTFLDWYLQALLSLQFAYEEIGFTHFGINGINVVVRVVKPHRISYPLRKRQYTVQTSTVVTIRNYDLASFVYEGKRYSIAGPYGEYIESFPLYDAYRLLAVSYKEARKTGNIFPAGIMRKIFQYFTSEEDVDAFFEAGEEWYSVLPPRVANKDLYDLIDYVVSLRPPSLVVTLRPPSLVSSPWGGGAAEVMNFSSADEVGRDVGLPGLKRPTNLEELYSSAFALRDSPGALASYLRLVSPGDIVGFQRILWDKVSEFTDMVRDLPPREEAILEAVSFSLDLRYDLFALKDLSPLFPSIDTGLLSRNEEEFRISLDALEIYAQKLRDELINELSYLDRQPGMNKEKAFLRITVDYLTGKMNI